MDKNEIWHSIEQMMKAEKKKHPHWPDHIAAQAGIVSKESGQLMRHSLLWKYERDANEVVREVQVERIQNAALKTIVASIRLLENLEE